jgi:hypothetical protein
VKTAAAPKVPGKKKKKMVKQPHVPVVFCKDINAFVERVAQMRGKPTQQRLLYKFGMDDGQGFLKIDLSIVDPLAQNDPKEKKFKQKLKDTGVCKCFIVAQAPAKETYDNLKLLLEKISFYDFQHPFVITADLKLISIACGTSSAGAAKFPCPLCLWEKGSLQKGAEKRSFSYNMQEHQRFVTDFQGNLKQQAKCHNSVNEPLPLNSDPDDLVMDVFACPTIHLFMGLFNKIHEHLVELAPEIWKWSESLGVIPKDYHGGHFEVGFVIGAWRRVSMGVEDGRRPPALREATPEIAMRPFQV